MSHDTTQVHTINDGPICLYCQHKITRNLAVQNAERRANRKFCSLEHRNLYWTARNPDGTKVHLTADQEALLVDVRELLGVDNTYGFTPETPERIAERLNTTVVAIAGVLRGLGYKDLAAPFWAEYGRQRKRRQGQDRAA